jgi:choline kinase
MKAIILSAGQGRRLMPMTESTPKCALPVQGRMLIEWQIDQLCKCGVSTVAVVVGYGAATVEQALGARYTEDRVHTLFNPFFDVADNLASCWLAREEMEEDFLLINGDTLFEPAVLMRLLESPLHPITLARDCKARYDTDDMKVSIEGDQLLRIGKDLDPDIVDGESIGMLLFRGDGPELFRSAVQRAMRRPEGLKQWYLSVINELARTGSVWTVSIHGLQWQEVDYPADFEKVSRMVAGWLGSEKGMNPMMVESRRLGSCTGG